MKRTRTSILNIIILGHNYIKTLEAASDYLHLPEIVVFMIYSILEVLHTFIPRLILDSTSAI